MQSIWILYNNVLAIFLEKWPKKYDHYISANSIYIKGEKKKSSFYTDVFFVFSVILFLVFTECPYIKLKVILWSWYKYFTLKLKGVKINESWIINEIINESLT